MRLINGECIEEMQKLVDEGVVVDSIITDIPYGITSRKWDSVIPLDKMWPLLKKLIKPTGAIVLFGSQPFTSALISSNYEMFKYSWVWKKSKCINFVQAKNMPLKMTEDIVVFSSAPMCHKSVGGDRRMEYNPQGLIECNFTQCNYPNYHGVNYPKEGWVQKNTNYPKTIIDFDNSSNKERGLHPTQKPVALMEYLIKTYTTEGETVLDFTMGSNSTGLACKNLDRHFIGIELDKDYFDIAVERIR